MNHLERRRRIVLAGTIECVFTLSTPVGERVQINRWLQGSAQP